MMDVTNGNTVAANVIPHGKHTAGDLRVAFFKALVGNLCRCPTFIEVFAVQVVVIVSCLGNYIDKTVGDTNHLVSLSLHVLGVCIAVVPHLHHNVIGLDGCLALGMCQRAPQHSLLAKALHMTDQMVG